MQNEIYYVLSDYAQQLEPENNADQTIDTLNKLIQEGKAVKMPMSSGTGKSMSGYNEMLKFIQKYEQDPAYVKYELQWTGIY